MNRKSVLKKRRVSLSLSPDDEARLDRIGHAYAKRHLPGSHMTRATVVRALMTLGARVAERDLGLSPPVAVTPGGHARPRRARGRRTAKHDE